MGAVTVPSSASQAPFASFSDRRSPPLRRPAPIRVRCSAFLAPQEPATVQQEAAKESKKRLVKSVKKQKRVKPITAAAAVAVPAPPAEDLDYNEVAAALENIYKLSPGEVSDANRMATKRGKRMSLERRVELRRKKKEENGEKKREVGDEEDAGRLVREYSWSSDLGLLDWKRMKIPPVLSSSKQAQLFKLVQPMKAIFEVKKNMRKDLDRDPEDGELTIALDMSAIELRKHIEIGQAARNKLIKHNLRLVLFVMNKYFQEFANSDKFQDLCQAGVKGLITAIDRFEPKRGFRLSTYGLFWIRHAIVRSMTISSFTRVPFGIESIRQEIQKAKLKLMFELGRLPTDDEIIARVRISPKRYHDVVKTSKAIGSLNARHAVTQEEFINGIADIDGAGRAKHRQPPLLRLALDDVLDSLKPKESLVIRQRFGLDGKGNRTLGEIAGNLNISREMVRKHELKALMKLKHPTRVDYIRRYI